MEKEKLDLGGYIRHQLSKVGLPRIRIEAWDKDNLKDDLVGSAVTDTKGRFSIELEQKPGGWNLKDRKPDIYFRIYAGDNMLLNTKDSVMLNLRSEKIEILLEDFPSGLYTFRLSSTSKIFNGKIIKTK